MSIISTSNKEKNLHKPYTVFIKTKNKILPFTIITYLTTTNKTFNF